MAATNPQPGSLGFGRYNGQNVPLKVESDGTLVTSGGGGGGGAVTIADGADVAEGAIADTSVTGDNTGTVSAKLRGLNKIWASVWDSINSRINVYIQNTTLAVTQSGSWVLSAGSAIIGKVSIDQTTPGTTNGVQTLSGSTTAVTQATAASLNATVVGTGAFAVQAAQSGTWTVQPGNTANTTAWKVDGSAVTQPVSGTVTAAQATASSLNATVVGTGVFATQQAGFKNVTWSTGHAPAANTKATITKAAAGVGVSNVCTGFTVSISAASTAPAAVQLSVALIDGASGGGTYLWGPTTISLPAVAGATVGFVVGHPSWFVGTTNTAMTLEFSAAGGANTVESVSMSGTTI